MDVALLRRRVLRWYDTHQRDLPWRRTRDPYAIWVSEVMLQQTRVDVVVPYFERWMARFPNVKALSKAREDTVLGLWSGLGYYSRARNLHKAARMVKGRLPTDAAGLLGLPGIGPYTAAAMASIAYGEPVAAIDGNIERVTARLLALSPARTKRGMDAIAKATTSWIPGSRPGDWNQALMDLGATICLPANPRCGKCPVADVCRAQAQGSQHLIPEPTRKAAPKRERHRFALLRRRGKILLVKQPAGLLEGMWMLPTWARPASGVQPSHDVGRHARVAGLEVQGGAASFAARHAFSHRTWDMTLHLATTWKGTVSPNAKWFDQRRLGSIALPAAMVRLLAAGGIEVERPGQGKPRKDRLAPQPPAPVARKAKTMAASSGTQ